MITATCDQFGHATRSGRDCGGLHRLAPRPASHPQPVNIAHTSASVELAHALRILGPVHEPTGYPPALLGTPAA